MRKGRARCACLLRVSSAVLDFTYLWGIMRTLVFSRIHIFVAVCLISTPTRGYTTSSEAQSAAAQSSPPLTVEEAVTRAIKQNPRLVAALREVVVAQSGVRSARALTNPNFVFTPGLTSIGGSDEELLFQQPLELNGARAARTGVASAQLRQAQARAIVELRDLVADTKAAYYELARAQELLSLSQESLKVAEEFDRITRRQVDLGSRPGIDQVLTGIEVTRARQLMILAQSRVTTALAALNTLMGRLPTEPIAPLPTLTFTPANVDGDAAAQLALKARAEIAVEASLQEAFRQEARLARAEGRPDLVPQIRAESVIRGLHNGGIGLGVTLPFLDYGSRRHRIRQAEAAASAQEARIAATQNLVRQEVEQALARLRAAEEVIKGYQQGILEQARRLLDGSRTGFQAGLTSVVAVLEAQRTYRAVLAEYTNALADYAQARAELERATGAVPADLLPRLESER